MVTRSVKVWRLCIACNSYSSWGSAIVPATRSCGSQCRHMTSLYHAPRSVKGFPFHNNDSPRWLSGYTSSQCNSHSSWGSAIVPATRSCGSQCRPMMPLFHVTSVKGNHIHNKCDPHWLSGNSHSSWGGLLLFQKLGRVGASVWSAFLFLSVLRTGPIRCRSKQTFSLWGVNVVWSLGVVGPEIQRAWLPSPIR